MTEPRKPSKPERELADFLDKANIPYVWGKSGMPPVCHPETGEHHYPDFYIPHTSLYIEVKGLLTLREVRKMLRITASSSNYYLYEATDPDWRPSVGDWPSSVMPRWQGLEIERAAEASTLAYLRCHPERATRSSLSRKGRDEHWRCAVQRSEILLLSQHAAAASAAGQVVRTRLRHYLIEHIDSQGWVTPDVLAKLRAQASGP